MPERPVTEAEIARLIDRIFEPRAPRVSTLDVLTGLAVALAALQEAERGWLEAARDEGRSWTEIGHALGITPQSARQRLRGRPRAEAQTLKRMFSSSTRRAVELVPQG